MFHFVDPVTKKNHYFDEKAITHVVTDARKEGGFNVAIHIGGHTIPSLLMSDDQLDDLLMSIGAIPYPPPPQ